MPVVRKWAFNVLQCNMLQSNSKNLATMHCNALLYGNANKSGHTARHCITICNADKSCNNALLSAIDSGARLDIFLHCYTIQCNAIRCIAIKKELLQHSVVCQCQWLLHCCQCCASGHFMHCTIHCQCCASGQAPHFSLTAIKTCVLDMLVGTVIMMMMLRMMRIVMMTIQVFY